MVFAVVLYVAELFMCTNNVIISFLCVSACLPEYDVVTEFLSLERVLCLSCERLFLCPHAKYSGLFQSRSSVPSICLGISDFHITRRDVNMFMNAE